GIATIVFSNGSQLTVSGQVIVGAAGNTNRRGSLNMTSGGTLICTGIAYYETPLFTPGTGTIVLTASNTLPASVFNSFNILTISGGTTTISSNLTANTLTTNPGGVLEMQNFLMTVTTINNGGHIRTSNTSATP